MAYRLYLAFLFFITVYVFKTWGLCDASFFFLLFLFVSVLSERFLFRPEDSNQTECAEEVIKRFHTEEVTRVGESGATSTAQAIADLLETKKQAEVRFEQLLRDLAELKAIEEREQIREQIMLFLNTRKDTTAQDLLDFTERFVGLVEDMQLEHKNRERCRQRAAEVSKLLAQYDEENAESNE